MRVLTFEEYQKELIENFKKINSLFLENNINWFAYAGTLLGSVRNNKIIPWDDDIDMAMKSDEFSKNSDAISNISKELGFHLRKRANHTGLVCNKIISNEKVIVKFNEEEYITDFCIDIFIYVPIKKKSNIQNNYFSIYNKVIFIFSRFWKPLPDFKMKNGKARKINFLTQFLVWLGRIFVLPFLLLDLFERNRFNLTDSSELYTLHCKESNLNDYYEGDLIKWTFEGIEILIQKNYEEVLSNKFGKSYLELPAFEYRNPSHIYNGEFKN